MAHREVRRNFALFIFVSIFFAFAASLAAEQKAGAKNVQSHDSKVEAGVNEALHQMANSGTLVEFDPAGSALEELIKSTEPTPAATCTATANCGIGPSISCGPACPSDSEDQSCPSERGWVQCGFFRIWCPPCNPCGAVTPPAACPATACPTNLSGWTNMWGFCSNVDPHSVEDCRLWCNETTLQFCTETSSCAIE